MKVYPRTMYPCDLDSPYLYTSMRLFDEITKSQLRKISAYKSQGESIHPHAREIMEGIERDYQYQLSLREQGYYVADELCDAEGGYFDWVNYYKDKHKELEVEVASALETLKDPKYVDIHEAVQRELNRLKIRMRKTKLQQRQAELRVQLASLPREREDERKN